MNPRRKILIINDEPAVVDVLKECLIKNSYNVITSSGARNGLLAAERERPDLIMLDVLLPYVSGWEVCRRLKKNETTKDIPVVFLSADFSEENMPKAKAFGIKHILMKPIKQEKVFELLEEIFPDDRPSTEKIKNFFFPKIKKMFLERAYKRLKEINEMLQHSPVDYYAAGRELHRILGTAGTLGLHDLSDSAGRILGCIDSKSRSNKKIKKLFNELTEKVKRSRCEEDISV